MSVYSVNPAGFSHLSPRLVGPADNCFQTCNGGREFPSSCGVLSKVNVPAIVADFLCQGADEDFALDRVCRYVSRLCSGTALGLFMRPAAARSSASATPPCGLRFPSQSCSQQRRKDFSGPSVNAELRHLGAWPTPPFGAPTKIGRFHKRRHS